MPTALSPGRSPTGAPSIPERTGNARQHQVVGRRWTSRLSRNDVVDVKSRFLPDLGRHNIHIARLPGGLRCGEGQRE